jgi:D,D-heptose 1,7-bisphosphate phosphatase
MLNKAVFLDRDGTINEDIGYIGNPNLIKLLPGVVEGIKRLKKNGFLIIVITNQSGIARGLFTRNDVELCNNRINEILTEENTKIDQFYYCPYHPEFDTEEKSNCRKPSPHMIFEAAKKNNIDLSKSFMIGDRVIDMQSGQNAGVNTILITNTISNPELIELKNSHNSPNFISSNFLDAVNYIEKSF